MSCRGLVGPLPVVRGQNNDFCLHQYPLMRALGYELVDVENGYQSSKYHGIERLKTLDTHEIRSHDEILKMCSMQVDAPEKTGKCNEGDAYWKHASATLPPPRWREQTENPKTAAAHAARRVFLSFNSGRRRARAGAGRAFGHAFPLAFPEVGRPGS